MARKWEWAKKKIILNPGFGDTRIRNPVGVFNKSSI